MLVVGCFGGHSREEFTKELCVIWLALDTKDFRNDFGRFTTVGEPCSVDFKVQEDWDEFITIHHGLKLHSFEMRCRFDSGIGFDINKH